MSEQAILQNNSPKILMMAAGTGGHVFPALAVAEELTKKGAIVHWLGTPAGMENGLVKPVGYQFHAIDMVGLRGKGISRLLKLPFTLINAILQAKKVIKEHNIDVVVGFGGYVTAPGGLAAKLLGKPLLIHEQNAIAGMSNRYLAKLSNKVMQAFANTFEGSETNRTKFTTVGNPVREAIVNIAPPSERFIIDNSNNAQTQALKLLVVGGSLGAQVLNDTVPATIKLMNKAVSVRHQCGKNNFEATQANYKGVNTDKHSYVVTPFIDDMAEAYAWADVIVCRAGALTVTEIQNVGLPAIFVPLPHAVDDHQTANARSLSDTGAAYLLPQDKLSPQSLVEPLLAFDTEKCLAMAEKGRSKANPYSTQTVAEIIWEHL